MLSKDNSAVFFFLILSRWMSHDHHGETQPFLILSDFKSSVVTKSYWEN